MEPKVNDTASRPEDFFRGANDFERSYRKLVDRVSSDEIRVVVNAFTKNMNRVSSISTLPTISCFLTAFNERARCVGEYRVTNQVALPGPEDEAIEHDKATLDAIANAAQAARASYVRRLNAQPDLFGKFASMMGNDMLAMLLLVTGSGEESIRTGIEAALASEITGAWTAFEAFATDLWISSINMRPMSLGIKALDAQAWTASEKGVHINQRKDENAKAKTAKGHEPINFDLLAKFQFNLSNKLGTALHQSQKFNFNRLDGICNAYSAVFGEDATNAFEKHFDKLSTLEAIRNVLVHRGGVIDEKFIGRVKKDLLLSKLPEKTALPINGPMAASYVQSVIDFATDLLTVVEAGIVATVEHEQSE